jgi:hypothetical protein
MGRALDRIVEHEKLLNRSVAKSLECVKSTRGSERVILLQVTLAVLNIRQLRERNRRFAAIQRGGCQRLTSVPQRILFVQRQSERVEQFGPRFLSLADLLSAGGMQFLSE